MFQQETKQNRQKGQSHWLISLGNPPLWDTWLLLLTQVTKYIVGIVGNETTMTGKNERKACSKQLY